MSYMALPKLMILKDHRCTSFCFNRSFTSHFYQLKNKSRNKSAYEGINTIEKEYCF